MRMPASDATQSSVTQEKPLLPLPASKVEKGIAPPHATYTPEPAFTDEAHGRGFQGTVILSLRVDEKGRTQDIKITGPLGCGLDAQAVRAVADWKFIPASKDKHPVGFLVAAEINFHLY